MKGAKQLSDYNCPASHLVVKAKYAISRYRKRGSGVDGKLDTRSRSKHYHILSLMRKEPTPKRHPFLTSYLQTWLPFSLTKNARL
jgi:hypothetical protein